MKYARVSAMVTWSGGKLLLSQGTTTADDDHPLVLERPDLWTDEAPPAHLAGPGRLAADRGDVERATAKPGDKRTTRRG
jgi:hypothetical protein